MLTNSFMKSCKQYFYLTADFEVVLPSVLLSIFDYFVGSFQVHGCYLTLEHQFTPILRSLWASVRPSPVKSSKPFQS